MKLYLNELIGIRDALEIAHKHQTELFLKQEDMKFAKDYDTTNHALCVARLVVDDMTKDIQVPIEQESVHA